MIPDSRSSNIIKLAETVNSSSNIFYLVLSIADVAFLSDGIDFIYTILLGWDVLNRGKVERS